MVTFEIQVLFEIGYGQVCSFVSNLIEHSFRELLIIFFNHDGCFSILRKKFEKKNKSQ